MDPLSQMLSLMKPRGYMFRGLDAAGQWSLLFPGIEGIKCYAVHSGACWLTVEGLSNPVQMTAGDCVLLPGGRPCHLSSDITLPSVDPQSVFSTTEEGGVATINGGGDCFGVGGFFAFSGNHADLLVEMLPPIVYLRKDADRAVLLWCLERLMQELRDSLPGRWLIAEHLAQMLLVQALRLHMAEGSRGGTGWLFALADKQMRPVLGAMHGDPARRWTLQALAEVAGMSRSVFALRFREIVGSPAMDYLTRLRMLLAGNRLMHGGEPISVIAPSFGYESESAFTTAFKRVMGCSPRQYSRRTATSEFRAAQSPLSASRYSVTELARGNADQATR